MSIHEHMLNIAEAAQVPGTEIEVFENPAATAVMIMGRFACVSGDERKMDIRNEFNQWSIADKPNGRFLDAAVRPRIARLQEMQSRGISPTVDDMRIDDWVKVVASEACWMFLDGDLDVDDLALAKPDFSRVVGGWSARDGCESVSSKFAGQEMPLSIDGQDFALRIQTGSKLLSKRVCV